MKQLAFAPGVRVLDVSVPHDDATVSSLWLATLRKKVEKEEEAKAKARKDLQTLGGGGGCRADDLPPHGIQQRPTEHAVDTSASRVVKKCVEGSKALLFLSFRIPSTSVLGRGATVSCRGG